MKTKVKLNKRNKLKSMCELIKSKNECNKHPTDKCIFKDTKCISKIKVLDTKYKNLTKQKDQLRSELIKQVSKGDIAYPLFPVDVVGVDHYASIKLKNRYICSLSTLLDKYPKEWKKYHDEDIIKMIVYPTINYKPKVRKVA